MKKFLLLIKVMLKMLVAMFGGLGILANLTYSLLASNLFTWIILI